MIITHTSMLEMFGSNGSKSKNKEKDRSKNKINSVEKSNCKKDWNMDN